MFPEPTELLLIGCLIESILDPKIQVKYIDSKNQLADTPTKGNFTRDKWNHLLSLFYISHFGSTDCSEVMSKRTQKDSGEARVTAKSKPMMNLVSRCSVRDPNVFASTASERLEKTRSESHNVPLSSWMCSKQSDTVAESDLSLKSRSFMNRVNDRLRKMLNRFPEDSMLDIDKRSMIWWMFMSSTVEASVFMGKNYSDNLHSIKNTGENLTLKQMFEISEQLILEQSDEIFWVSQISWESSPWKQLSLVNDEDVISLSHAKVYVFSDSVLCLAKMNQNPTSNAVWKRHLGWFKDSAQSTENQWNSSEYFSRIHHIAARRRSPKVHEQNERTWTIPRTNYLHADVQWHHMVISRQWNGMYCWFHTCVYILQKDFQQDVGHSSTWIRKEVVFYLQRKTTRRMGQSRWIDDDQIQRKRTPSFPSNESVRSRNAQNQRRWKIIDTLLCRWWYD